MDPTKKLIFFFILILYSGIATASNNSVLNISDNLPDGYPYATVELSTIPDYCPCDDEMYDAVKIKITASTGILVPLQNFGIESFGFNYAGDVAYLWFEIVDDENYDWDINLFREMSEFGRFVIQASGTPTSRKNPLEIIVCGCEINLSQQDFIVYNKEGYLFSAHILDFVFQKEPGINSAYFSSQEWTLVSFSSFEAYKILNTAVLIWKTDSEIDNAGFNIYRAETENGSYNKINERIIPSKGSTTTGSVYVYYDNGVSKNYYYMIEDIDLSGKSTTHGPIKAKGLQEIFGK